MARKNTYRVDETLEEEFNLKHLLLASKYIKRYLPKLLGAMTFSAIAGLSVLFSPIVTKKALDEAVPNKDVKMLVTQIIILIGCYVLCVICAFIRSCIFL